MTRWPSNPTVPMSPSRVLRDAKRNKTKNGTESAATVVALTSKLRRCVAGQLHHVKVDDADINNKEDIAQNISGYIVCACQSQLNNVQRGNWQNVTIRIVEEGMTSYSEACWSKCFFFDLCLTEPFSLAARDVCHLLNIRSPDMSAIKQLTDKQLKTRRQHDLLFTAIAKACLTSCPVMWHEMLRCVHESYATSIERSPSNTLQHRDEQYAISFMSMWIRQSLAQASDNHKLSQLLPHLVQSGSISNMFRRILSPRLCTHSAWSCIPFSTHTACDDPHDQMETEKETRWHSLLRVVHSLPYAIYNIPRHRQIERPRHVQTGEGNAQCTSDSGCIGNPSDHLIQHLLPDDRDGDVYCDTCWRSLNAHLSHAEGMWISGHLRGQYYCP